MSSEYLTEEEHERLQRARSIVAALENKPLPLWRLFREALLSGGACRDIVEKHVMCKLNGTDLKFFYDVNTETRKLIKRSSRARDLKKSFIVKEMSSISTLEFAWEHKSLWTSGWWEKEKVFCWQVARTNKLELLKWAREEKECEWDAGTIHAAAHQGNLEMVKYCDANECPVDEGACGLAAENGHLEVLKYLREEAKAPWDSWTATRAASNGHLHILEYLVERKFDEFTEWAVRGCGQERPLRLFEVLTRNRQSAVELLGGTRRSQEQTPRMCTIPSRQQLSSPTRLAIRARRDIATHSRTRIRRIRVIYTTHKHTHTYS